VSSRNEERAFRHRNASRSYAERVRPFGFVSTCRPHRLERETSGIRTLVAPFETDPQTRMCTEWVDRHDPSGHRYRVRLGEPARVVPGEVCVESYGDYFTEFASHPEAKAAGSDGGLCMPWTKGVLGPREIVATMLVRVGKEANRLAEDPALVDDPEDRVLAYPELVCLGCGRELSGRQQRWCSDACRKRVARGAQSRTRRLR